MPKPPKTVKLPGSRLELDGDVVFLIDRLYRDVALAGGLVGTYQEVKEAIDRVWQQMDAASRKEYFSASLFLNYVTYENEMLERAAEVISRRARRG